MLLAVSSCMFLALAFAVSWWALRIRKVDFKNWAGASLLVLWVAGVWVKAWVETDARGAGEDSAAVHAPAPAGAAGRAASAGSVLWSAAARIAAQAPAARRDGGKPVGSVESLIGPLEARLAQQPDDAGGWSLLAQSYAFVGDDAGTEKAVARAVSLGADEKMLRERIAALRSAPPQPRASRPLGRTGSRAGE